MTTTKDWKIVKTYKEFYIQNICKFSCQNQSYRYFLRKPIQKYIQ